MVTGTWQDAGKLFTVAVGHVKVHSVGIKRLRVWRHARREVAGMSSFAAVVPQIGSRQVRGEFACGFQCGS